MNSEICNEPSYPSSYPSSETPSNPPSETSSDPPLKTLFETPSEKIGLKNEKMQSKKGIQK
jgi:hypothetical protein